jgi:GH35 family endo-1,4-beta-xylanase
LELIGWNEVKFLVFNKGKKVSSHDLYGAYVFGGDGIAIRRVKISFEDGVIECKKTTQATSGLALLWPVEGFGKLLLPTTCLPERQQPYNLNVEIARAKLMQIINKREDWSVFSSPPVLTELSEQSQDLFIGAVQNLSNPAKAAQLADDALRRAMIFSEKLSIRQADSFFNAKSTTHGFSRGCLGCRLDLNRINDSTYIDRLLELFGFVLVPVKWSQVESKKGKFEYSLIDESINVLNKKKLAICAGPLLKFSPDCLPEWLLTDKKADFEKIRESAYRFILNIVSRYADRIRSWIVLSGLNMHNHFGFDFEQTLEITRASNMAVKSISNRVLKIIEISNPWGEYYAQLENTIPPVVYIDMIMQSGIGFDAFGLQMQFGKNDYGMHVRDMMTISASLDRFALLGKALYITGVEVPSVADSDKGEFSGVWHSRWDEELQGQWIEQFYKIALSKPFIDSIIYSNLVDNNQSVIANSGLLKENLEPKRSFMVAKRMRDVIFNR